MEKTHTSTKELLDIIRRGITTTHEKNVAKSLGISETANKILAFINRRKGCKYLLKIAFTPEEHLHAMNVAGSCQRADGTYYHGAQAITSGPALIIEATDAHGNVRGRTVFTLWENDEGEKLFLPNYSYGGVDVVEAATKLLRENGFNVHNDIKPPEGFRPAKSRFKEREFWKDEHGLTEFKPIK